MFLAAAGRWFYVTQPERSATMFGSERDKPVTFHGQNMGELFDISDKTYPAVTPAATGTASPAAPGSDVTAWG